MVVEDRGGGSSNQRRCIILGNTHLFFHPLADHIRLLQAVILEKELERLKTEMMKQTNLHKAAGIILCGDLNRCCCDYHHTFFP